MVDPAESLIYIRDKCKSPAPPDIVVTNGINNDNFIKTSNRQTLLITEFREELRVLVNLKLKLYVN